MTGRSRYRVAAMHHSLDSLEHHGYALYVSGEVRKRLPLAYPDAHSVSAAPFADHDVCWAAPLAGEETLHDLLGSLGFGVAGVAAQ
jgi:hypothetical protein